jgi:DNA adenine methylase
MTPQVLRPAHQLFPSPLRYPGGKGKLADYVKLVLVENDLVGSEYVEPYAGGAAVALALLFEEYASHVHINDVNRSIYTFWKVVLSQPDDLCRRIAKAKLSIGEWDRQRAVQRDPDAEPLDLAFSTLYMNRTNRSGIIAGGIIGGREQTGQWKIDARFRPKDLIQRIEKIARFRSRITLTGIDTEHYLRHNLPDLNDIFAYLDPPYYTKGKRLYENFYEHDDHVRIAGVVQELKIPWIVSYDARSEIEDMYKDRTKVNYGLNYTARHRTVGAEIMIFSDDLSVPDAEPTEVSLSDLMRARCAA